MAGRNISMHASHHPTIISLWPDGVPESEHDSSPEQETTLASPQILPHTLLPLPFGIKIARNITRPTLTAYLPDPSIATGAAVVICPGGAFNFLAIEREGIDVARWLCERGIAAFVLKYRVAPTEAGEADLIRQLEDRFTNLVSLLGLMEQIEPLALADAQQALNVVRQRAADWGIAPQRIGILGFSTGGTIAIGAAMQYDERTRPDFAAAIYPAFSRRAITVPPDAPALFVLAASDDPMAVATGVPLYSAWREASQSAELHLYARGGHAFAMNPQGLPSDSWADRLADWLQSQHVGAAS
jgi:acetyl esterase/lipase